LKELLSCRVTFSHRACSTMPMESAKEYSPHRTEAPSCCYGLCSVSQKRRGEGRNNRFNDLYPQHSPSLVRSDCRKNQTHTQGTATRPRERPAPPPRPDAFPRPPAPAAGARGAGRAGKAKGVQASPLCTRSPASPTGPPAREQCGAALGHAPQAGRQAVLRLPSRAGPPYVTLL